MAWITLGEDGGTIKLVSKTGTQGILPKGSYITIETDLSKHILRVDSSSQSELYSPSPMMADMDFSIIPHDQTCKNIVKAYRVKDISKRKDGLIDFIKPLTTARRSNQEEIDLATGSPDVGAEVFVATVHFSKNQKLIDSSGRFITVKIPEEAFFHQMLVCGKTGSGKTVSTKYLAQHFVEKMDGAVLAINVKDVDFLKMNKSSETINESVIEEWNDLGLKPHGLFNFVVYYPANTSINSRKDIDKEFFKAVTLDVHKIGPESISGLLQGISDVAAQNLPNIFRYWQTKIAKEEDKYIDFKNYFSKGKNDDREFRTLNDKGDEGTCPLHSATFANIERNLDNASDFFDNGNAKTLDFDDILQRGKMSIINVAEKKGVQFGSILLRDLLSKIIEAKNQDHSNIPILIIIDEVHQFYHTDSSRDALGDLDTICRTGRSKKIGVIFSSQNVTDIPKGLSSVINTKLFFKSDGASAKSFGVKISDEEMESLGKGYCAANIHNLNQIKFLKFPLSLSGVFEDD